MPSSLQLQFKVELDAIAAELAQAAPSADYDDLSDLGEQFALRMTTRAGAAIQRAAGAVSVYASQFEAVLVRKDLNDFSKLQMAMGILEALRADIAAGYLNSLPELIHGDIFADYLEMADHLLEERYKDAGAVLAGGTLESHLRQLSQAKGIPTTTPTASGPRPKKAEQVNADLAQAGVLTKPDSKNVTAWLALRNNAAHANYDQYSAEQVRLLVSSVRDFISRNPA